MAAEIRPHRETVLFAEVMHEVFAETVLALSTKGDIIAADTEAGITVLPIAAIKQHGPHLAVGVDALIPKAMLARAATAMPEDSPVTFLPLQEVCKSGEHIAFPGTLTLDQDVAIKAWLHGKATPAPECGR